MSDPQEKYDRNEEPVVISKHTLDVLLKQDKPGDLIALYTFYYYTAKWQRTNQTRCTTGYVAKGLGWTEERVRSRKKILVGLGLIQDVVARNEINKITGHYVRIKFIWTKEKSQEAVERLEMGAEEEESHTPVFPGGGESLGVAIPGTNALRAVNSNALRSVRKNLCSGKNPERLDHCEKESDGVISRKRKPPTKTITMEVPDLEEKNELYLPYVQRLAQIVCSAPGVMRSKQKVQLNAARTKQWVNEIRLLCDKDGITTNKLSRVLDWYAEHIGGEFIPEVESASSLRKKWPKLLAAIERGKNKPSKKPGGIKQLLGGAAAIPGKYDDVKTIVIDNTKF